MAQERFVTREEFENVRSDTQRLSIRVEVMTNDLHRLELRFADFVENTDKRFDRLEERMDRLEERMDRLEERMDRLEERMDRLEHRIDALESNVLGSIKALETTFLTAIARLSPRN